MKAQRRGFPFFPAVLLAAAVASVVAAALTTRWALLALIPVTMLGCVAMMATHRPIPCAPSARRSCCEAGSMSEAAPD